MKLFQKSNREFLKRSRVEYHFYILQKQGAHLIMKSLVLFALFILMNSNELVSKDRPNIVFFLSDDHGWRDSGVYGDSFVKTPNIDRLAGEGMLLYNAYAGSPLCSPSRSVIATGLMPHRNGGHKFGTAISTGIKTMPQYFHDLGYSTAHFGKFHHYPKEQIPDDYVDPDDNKAATFLDA